MSTANLAFKSSVARTILWFSNVAIAFFMVPFVVGKLGDRWYGIWTIIGSLMGYYHMVDLGIAAAVQRYVAQYIAQKDDANANVVINTSLVIYFYMGLVLCVISIFVAMGARFFITDHAAVRTVQFALLIMGINLALLSPNKSFSGIMAAYLRFDLYSYQRFVMDALSVTLTVIVLRRGHGILALAWIAFGVMRIANVSFYLISKHLFPAMRISREYFRRDRVKELFGYGVWSFVIQTADQLRFNLDAIVVAWMLNSVRVTHYAIGANLAQYFFGLIGSATNFLVPIFTKYHAVDDYHEIRSKLLFLTKINAVLSIFGGGSIIILGKPFITRWMGTHYLDAYPVLVVVMTSVIIESIYTPSRDVLYAIAKHRYLAIVNIIEGFVKVGLSIVLLKYMGIVGAALGTAIPIFVSRLYLMPSYVCQCIDLPLKKYYSNLAKTAIFTIAYLGLFGILANNFLTVPTYFNIAKAGLLAGPFYALAVFFIAFNKPERKMIWSMLESKAK